MIVGIHHVAISVTDIDRAVEFYTGALGFEVVQTGGWQKDNPLADRAIGLADTHTRMAMLKAPNAHIELFQYEHPEPEDKRARPCDYGYTHFCLQVDGIQEEYVRLSAAGMEFVGEPVDFGQISAIYGRDPFGNVIELYEIRDPEVAQLAR